MFDMLYGDLNKGRTIWLVQIVVAVICGKITFGLVAINAVGCLIAKTAFGLFQNKIILIIQTKNIKKIKINK